MGSVFCALKRPLQLLCLPALLIAGSGCSSFNYEWRRTVKTEVPNNSPQGPWEGRWKSDANGHSGRLRCLITSKGPTGTEARFRATFARIFTYEYAVPVSLIQETNRLHLEGAANLGWLAGGRYTYDGFLTSTQFNSTYRSRHDHGVFELTRPAGRR